MNRKSKHEFNLIDGKTIAERLLFEIRQEIVEKNARAGLAVIMIGDDEPSKLYVRNKEMACLKVGIEFHKYFCANESEDKIIDMIRFLNNDPAVSGIIVQLPLPKGYDTQKIINAIDPKKDADGFHPKNIKKILAGESEFYPPLVETVLYLLKSQEIKLPGKKIALLSHSEIFCPVMMKALENEGALPKIVDLGAEEIKKADIIIIALGKPRSLKGGMIKEDAVVIDIGITKTGQGFSGDADFESIKKVASKATPTPGGTGPMTVAMLLKKTLDLSKKTDLKNSPNADKNLRRS